MDIIYISLVSVCILVMVIFAVDDFVLYRRNRKFEKRVGFDNLIDLYDKCIDSWNSLENHYNDMREKEEHTKVLPVGEDAKVFVRDGMKIWYKDVYSELDSLTRVYELNLNRFDRTMRDNFGPMDTFTGCKSDMVSPIFRRNHHSYYNEILNDLHELSDYKIPILCEKSE